MRAAPRMQGERFAAPVEAAAAAHATHTRTREASSGQAMWFNGAVACAASV